MKVKVGDIPMELTDEQIEDLRRQLEVRRPDGDGLVDAATLAARLGVSRDYVYGHADELGAVRLGAGPRARLRFDPALAAERDGAAPEKPAAKAAKPRRRRQGRPADLLPIRGERR